VSKKKPKKKHLNKTHKPNPKRKPIIAPAWIKAQLKKKYNCDCELCFKDFISQIQKSYNKVQTKKHPSVPAWLRATIKKKYDCHCQLCFDQFIWEILTIHHIKPRWRGGTNDPQNLICLCFNCHAKIHAIKRTENVYNADGILIYNIES